MKLHPQPNLFSDLTLGSPHDSLPHDNQWVRLANSLPLADIELEYARRLNNGSRGAGNVPARIVVGALIIKHVTRLSDKNVIAQLRENVFMQYFVGLETFTYTPYLTRRCSR